MNMNTSEKYTDTDIDKREVQMGYPFALLYSLVLSEFGIFCRHRFG